MILAAITFAATATLAGTGAAATATTQPAARPAAATGAEAELQAIDQKFIDAFMKEDVETIVALYADDAVLMDPGPGLWVKGKDEIRKSFTSLFARLDNIKLTIHDGSYKVAGNSGWGAGLFHMSAREAPAGKQVEMAGRALSVFEKRGGKWVYVADHASVPTGAPETPSADFSVRPK